MEFPVPLIEATSLSTVLVKFQYQGINRDKISKEKHLIKSPLIESSNYDPPQKPEILNRLLLCKFKQVNFQLDGVIGFNDIRQNYLSNLLVSIIRCNKSKIIELFNKNRAYINSLNPNLGNRCDNNIAIAYTGYEVLLDIAEQNQPDAIRNNFEVFVKNYHRSLEIMSSWDEFLNALPALARNKKIIFGKDYKYYYDKCEKTENGEYSISLSPHQLCIHFEQAYWGFMSYYKQLKNDAPPSQNEILDCAKTDKRVMTDKGQTTKSITIGRVKKRCLVIDVREDNELSSLDKM